jgi:flagellin-like protein
MNKRGISPLIATLLLIGFAVALGVVIMSFGRAQVELEAQCAIDVGLKFSSIGGKQQFCLDKAKNQLKFTIENGVNIKVTGLVVNVIGTETADTFQLNDAKMVKAGTYLGKVPYASSIGGVIRQVKITPKVVLQDIEEVCSEKALISESVPPC